MSISRGIVLPQSEISVTSRLGDFCEVVEQAGFDHLLLYDHVLGAERQSRPGWTGVYDSSDPFLEPLVTFAHLASTTSLSFMSGVLVLPQRQTALVAKQVATLEALAPGRLRLGVGVGWNDVEYEALGAEFGNRGRRIAEQIDLLRRLLSEPVLDYRGTWETVDRAGIRPLPERPVPVWIGSGDTPAALRRVGRLADGWLPTPALRPGTGFEDAWRVVSAAAQAVGRDTAQIPVEGHVRLGGRDVARLRQDIDSWRDVGASAVVVNIMGNGLDWPNGHCDQVRRAGDAF